MAVHMQDLLTTDEAATYLRLSERKLYELVANGVVPCTKVTGRWLFPKVALDRWLAAGLITPALAHAPAPPIVGGSHDPLLEWALRESASGPIAALRQRFTLRQDTTHCPHHVLDRQPAGGQRGRVAAARTRGGRRGRDSPTPPRRR